MMRPNVRGKLEQHLNGFTQDVKQGMLIFWKGNPFSRYWIANRTLILLAVMAFLLGRATILDSLFPFAAAYFAVIYYLRRDSLLTVGIFLCLGSLLANPLHTGLIAAELMVFLLVQKALEKFERGDLSMAPGIVFFATWIVQIFGWLIKVELSWFNVAMVTVEAFLSFVLTLIFIQAVPILTFTRKKVHLKNEEIICLIILLASVMTGTVGWMYNDLTLEHVLTRYLILLFALVGGAPLGASVGVVAGLIVSLANVQAVSQISLLAFAGLLAGMFKEGGRMAVALGLLVGSTIMALYVGNEQAVLSSIGESLIAALLFFATSRRLVDLLATYIPGTRQNMKSHDDYAKRVRDITAGRVQQFSEVFRQLSRSFKQLTSEDYTVKSETEIEHFMNEVSQKTCATCWKKNICWDQQFYSTSKWMTEMASSIERNPDFSRKEITSDWKKHCVKTDHVMRLMKQQVSNKRYNSVWQRQIMESRQLVADQLNGVSQVMDDMVKEIKREGQELFRQEEQIRRALEDLGLSIHAIDIISLEDGKVEIEIIHPYIKGFDECRKIIAPLLSEIIGENITVQREEYDKKGQGWGVVTFGSANEFKVETGVAGVAKGGDLLSGDSFSTVALGNGKFAVALSDGMGNGERAQWESSTALSVLQQLLQSGMNERLAIKSVNSVLMLRSHEEMYATVDMALIDLYDAQTTFVKIGSTPSFVKRGEEVFPISANNLPVGIIKEIDVDLIRFQLKPGDILIMMSDGIYDAPGYAVNKELWMKRTILEIETVSPQMFADCLLERIIRHHHGEINDDMTVVVARIERHLPEWATISWQRTPNMDRPKTVS